MKRAILVFISFIFTFSAFAEIDLAKITGYNKKGYEAEYRIHYADESILIYLDEYLYTGVILIKDIEAFRSALQKFQEWKILALKNNLKTRKTIVEIECEAILMSSNDNSLYYCENITLDIQLLSANQVVYLALVYPELQAKENQFISIGSDAVVLDDMGSSSLIYAVSEKGISEAIENDRKSEEANEILK